MLKITELLQPGQEPLWRLVKQVGIDDAVSVMEGAEQQWRWPRPDGQLPEPYAAAPAGERPWDVAALTRLRDAYAAHGISLAVIEDSPPLDRVRLGQDGRDEQIGWFCDQLRAMGELGIDTLCYNWMPITTWARTSAAVTLRGGARSTGYDDELMREMPTLADPGRFTSEQLWENLSYFLHAVVPVAEEAGVRLAMHPDDPPLPEVRGVPHIMNSPAAFDRLISIVESPFNGITLCQGNFTLMTDDLPSVIRHFGTKQKVFFVHFRDVAGDVRRFIEVFHDEGKTDMLECMRAYGEVGFDGPMRPDHVPALEGESNETFGYSVLGRLFAIGYITGLREAVYGAREPWDGPLA